MTQCCIVDIMIQPVTNALVVIDGEPLQLMGNCFEISEGRHHIKVMHKNHPTEESDYIITPEPLNIILGGEPPLSG